jgi:hypothetical protein
MFAEFSSAILEPDLSGIYKSVKINVTTKRGATPSSSSFIVDFGD